VDLPDNCDISNQTLQSGIDQVPSSLNQAHDKMLCFCFFHIGPVRSSESSKQICRQP